MTAQPDPPELPPDALLPAPDAALQKPEAHLLSWVQSAPSSSSGMQTPSKPVSLQLPPSQAVSQQTLSTQNGWPSGQSLGS